MTTELISADVAQSVLTGMMMAAIYSTVFYTKKRLRNDEPFDQTKFIATVVVGAAVGASLKLAGIELTAGTLESTLATYAGTIALVESLVKSIWRAYQRRQK